MRNTSKAALKTIFAFTPKVAESCTSNTGNIHNNLNVFLLKVLGWCISGFSVRHHFLPLLAERSSCSFISTFLYVLFLCVFARGFIIQGPS